MRKVIVVLVLVSIIAVITNPKSEDYKSAYQNRILEDFDPQEYLDKEDYKVYSENESIILNVVITTINNYFDINTKVSNYLLFSICRWNEFPEDPTFPIGIGIFGQVFLHKYLPNPLNTSNDLEEIAV